MFRTLHQFFQQRIAMEIESGDDDQRALHLAVSALMVELARSDSNVDARELQATEKILQDEFGLSSTDTAEIVQSAQQEADAAVSLYEFTKLLNAGFDRQQKIRIIEMLWRVAMADGHLDRYEEHTIRNVAELLHVSHKDFVRTRLKVQGGE